MSEASRIVTRLAERADTQSDAVAFRFVARPGGNAEELTWSGLWGRAGATADRFARYAQAGELVSIACKEPLDYVVAIAACLMSGRVAVPLPTALSRRSAPRAHAVLDAVRPRVVLVSVAAPDWLNLAPEITAVPVAPDGDAAPAPAAPDAGAVALIQFSSGSTGTPKGVALSHANLAANCSSIADAYGLGAHSHALSWLPMHHDMGLIGHVMTPFLVGFVQTLTSPLRFLQRPLTWLELATQLRATITSAPNFAYELAARAGEEVDISHLDLGSLAVAISGGERVVRSTVERFVAVFGRAGLNPAAIAPSYGLAEATLLVASGLRTDRPRFVTSPGGADGIADLGPPVPSVTVRIVCADGTPVPPGKVGEIEVSGPSVGRMVGPDGVAGPAQPLRTGDIGFMAGGRLRVTGRLKDIIIVRGQNIAAGDVEAAVLAADDAVQPGGVCAIADQRDGTEDVLVVVEMARGSSQSPTDLARAVSAAVASAIGVVPADVLVTPVGALPRTPSGKIQRHIVRERILAGNLRLL